MTSAPDVRAIDVGAGLTLHLEIRGAGAPVVLLHGFTGDAGSLGEIAAALARRFTTIAVDLPGHGRSSAPTEPARYALPRLADDLATLLDQLAIPRAAVVGYSLGGRAALHFAVAHPHRVEALVLVSTSPGLEDERERAARAAGDAELADHIERAGVASFVDRWERLPLWASQGSLPAEVRAALRAQRLRNDPAGLANSLRGAGAGVTAPLHDRLGTIGVPALVVAGALDARYVEIATRMAAALPAATLRIIPGAGHAVHLEQPARLAEAVATFLPGQVTSARAARPRTIPAR